MKINKINHYSIPGSCTGYGEKCSSGSVSIPKAWEPRYDALDLNVSNLWREDITGAYTPQGACTDGTYIYRALVAEDDLPTWIQKIRISDGKIVAESKETSFGHANDMTYANGSLYIAHSSSTSIIYKVNPNTFALEETFDVPTTIWGIAYSPENNLFVLGGVGSAYFSVYYPDFSFMYRIKPGNPYYGMVRQGIFADGNYIYVSLDNGYGAVTGNELGSRIMVYTWNGIFVKSYHLNIKEVEWAIPIGADMYIGTYEGRDPNDVKSGNIYRVPFDMYPGQTNITGRPTDVSGGVNNLQRLPEGTPVRLWESEGITSGSARLRSQDHGIKVSENSPFRYIRFRFKGANQQVFDWYPINNGVPCLREFDVTAATSDSKIRLREMGLTFDVNSQTFTIETNFVEEIFKDVSEGTLTLTKAPADVSPITLTQIWGVV